jgi:prevent-host-death family protein
VAATLIVGVAEAHNRLSELIDQALSGADVVISRRGAPAVRLVGVPESSPLRPTGAEIAARSEARLATRHRLLPGPTDQELAARVAQERASWR